MRQRLKMLAKRLYWLFNHLPLNNRKKGKVQIENDGAILWRCRIVSTGSGNRLILRGGGLYRNCEFIFYGNNNVIEFGTGCSAKNGSFYTENDNNLIKSGKDTEYTGKIHIACTESTRCIVGDSCLFSSEIVIRTGDSHSIFNEADVRINQAKDVVIGNHVWVGYRVLITKGSVIPENCVIGTGTVLTNRVYRKNSVIVGVPAKMVKENVNWSYERI